NDHHVYKRTLPILKDRVDLANGVTYMGDGSWAVDIRKVPWQKSQDLEYIARGEDFNHLIRVTLLPDRQEFDAVNQDGRIFDHYSRPRSLPREVAKPAGD
ncbi:MAG: hypothetical protein AAF514_13975, partial [Verrucomicrobiota bacterium]